MSVQGLPVKEPDLFTEIHEAQEQEKGQKKPRREPLADRMRPRTLDEVVGQEEVLGENGFLRSAIEHDEIPSMILWGPPGSGKTSIAKVIAHATKARFVPFSAVTSGIKEVREVVQEAIALWHRERRRTILFVDEIHHLNKAQQDGFLPHVETGTIILIGATTENPFFEVTPPLLSRCRVVRLAPLREEHLVEIAKRALSDQERGLGRAGIEVPEDVLKAIAKMADGDARRLLNLLEACAALAKRKGKRQVDAELVQVASLWPGLRYDRAYEEHYNVVSAFIKSLRGSDPDAAMYYMARMLEGGEDPAFIIRRMIIFAAEDIGNADPQAIQVAIAVKEAYEYLGMPEAAIPMAQAVTYLATAPKSNAAYRALRAAQQAVRETGTLEVPLYLRNAPVPGMAELGYGQGYAYPHDYEGHYVPVYYLPEPLRGRVFYEPSDVGYEKLIKERLLAWRLKREAEVGK